LKKPGGTPGMPPPKKPGGAPGTPPPKKPGGTPGTPPPNQGIPKKPLGLGLGRP
jgi:hypothetical protein